MDLGPIICQPPRGPLKKGQAGDCSLKDPGGGRVGKMRSTLHNSDIFQNSNVGPRTNLEGMCRVGILREYALDIYQ